MRKLPGSRILVMTEGQEGTEGRDQVRNSLSPPERDAFKALLCAKNCLLVEDRKGPELVNVGTMLKPLNIPRSETWQLRYSMDLLGECDGDHTRILAARNGCVEHQNEASINHQNEMAECWSRAVDLCDQALRMIEGAGAVTDDKARRLLTTICKFTSYGIDEYGARAITETLRDLGGTMADVPSREALVSWALPWL